MIERPLKHVPILLSPAMPWLMHHAGHMLEGIYDLATVPPHAQPGRRSVYVGKELGLVVERADDDVATFVPIRIVPVVLNNVPPDGVVIRVYRGHVSSL